ncbi:hypothetical protein [Sphingomonas jeddahensis]|uniref:hypothetical protein n=1 Tax=Sphingomonas jeddahensis TaxID=1915074 RepID=UPI00130146AD|nr:hypothetical protein [Sphingomonas jeddahensis]
MTLSDAREGYRRRWTKPPPTGQRSRSRAGDEGVVLVAESEWAEITARLSAPAPPSAPR